MPDSAIPWSHSFALPPRKHPDGSGDEWVEDGKGRRFWGRFGAAGLLAFHPELGILLQHRAPWSHFGGTWGLPGGARHHNESAVQGAIREAHEEAGVPSNLLQFKFTSVLDLGFWSYTTVVAEVTEKFDPLMGDAESIELRWVAVDAVEALPLHPGFKAGWSALRAELERRTVLIVDLTNIIGSQPNGWRKDRRSAATHFRKQLSPLIEEGFSAQSLDLEHTLWWPETLLVAEGDNALIATVSRITQETTGPVPRVFVVTVDGKLGDCVKNLGAILLSPRWLLAQLKTVPQLMSENGIMKPSQNNRG